MIQIVKAKLPHGDIPFAKIKDTEIRDVIMKLNENVKSLKKQLETAQTAVLELQRR